MIYTYAVSPYEDWHRQAWAAGLVLLALVLAANVAARLLFVAAGTPDRLARGFPPARPALSARRRPRSMAR